MSIQTAAESRSAILQAEIAAATPFGETTSKLSSPWGFASKRLDPELGLIYFGKRYYDPESGRWLTTDPADFIDSINLYQYVFNNPFRYVDPDGRFAFVIPLLIWGAELVLPTITAWVAPMVYAAATATIAYGGYKIVQVLNERNSATACKNTDVYAPDRPLPKDKDGVPIPETDAPHTQLGTKKSKRRPGEKYPQAREFDENGKPVKTIDFTDHKEPSIHPNPHTHSCEPNPTGGTPQRGDPKPLENWKY